CVELCHARICLTMRFLLTALKIHAFTGPSGPAISCGSARAHFFGSVRKTSLMPHSLISQRQLAQLGNVSARTISRMALPRRGKRYDLLVVVGILMKRLLLAEKLCRRWCPGEIESRCADGR